jgi:hypothetical protein
MPSNITGYEPTVSPDANARYSVMLNNQELAQETILQPAQESAQEKLLP